MPQRLNAKTNAEITQNKVQKLKNKEMKERGVVLVGIPKITYRKGGDMFWIVISLKQQEQFNCYKEPK